MSMLSSAATFRRVTAGCALVIGPVLFAGAELLAPEQVHGDGAQLAEYAAHRHALLASSFLSISTALVLLAGTLGLVHLVRWRGVTFANLAAVLIGYGLVAAHAALGGIQLMFAEMAQPGLDRAAMVRLYHALTTDAGLGAPLLAGHYVFVVGLILLGTATWRGRVGPRWASVCLLLFPISDVLLGNVPVPGLADVVSNAFGIVGFAALGVHLLRMGNTRWLAGAGEKATTVPSPVPAIS